MNMLKYLLMILTLLFGSIMFLLSNLMFQWLLMEIFTMLMISYMNINMKNKMPSIIYFMVSSMSSILFIIIYFEMWPNLYILGFVNENFELLMMMMMLLKMGIFPFNFWLIYVIQYVKWIHIFFMSTFMKIIPLYVFSQLITDMNYFFMLLLILNMFITSILAWFMKSIKGVIACSSITQSSFLVYFYMMNKNMFMIYFFMYCVLLFMLIFLMMKFNIKLKVDLMILDNKYKNMFINIFLSYSMLPPYFSFVLKWMVVDSMFYNENYNLMMMIMIISSVIMIWNYFIILNYLILNNLKFKFYKINNNLNIINKYYIYILLILNFLLLILPNVL